MQKIKNPILCWIVILVVFIRPTPAHAAIPLVPVVVGAVIAASGAMVAGATVYKPPTFEQANAVVDAVTGDIKRKVVVARMFAEGVSGGLRGFSSQYTLDFSKATQWVKDHSPDFPVLYPAVQAGTDYTDIPTPVLNDVVVNPLTPSSRYQMTTAPVVTEIWVSGETVPVTGVVGGSFVFYKRLYKGDVYPDGSYSTKWQKNVYSCLPSTLPETYPAPIVPSKFASAYPQTEAGQDETDKIAIQNPASIVAAPQPMTAEQIKEGLKQIEKAIAEQAAIPLETASGVDPSNVPLSIAAQEARKAADLAAAAAEAAKAELEATPEEVEKTDTPPTAGPAPDADLALDFSPFLGLQDKAMSKFPFSMVSSLGSLFSGLTSAPVTPSMDVPMPWGMAPKQITLSHWDDFAGKWRMMIALFFHASCIYAIIRRYS